MLLVPLLFVLILGVGEEERDPPAVRRPRRRADRTLLFGQRLRLASIHADAPEVGRRLLAAAGRDEGNRLPVRGPRGSGRGLLRPGKRKSPAAVSGRDVDLRDPLA